MVRAKNYETVSKFVKVMPRIPWPFFPDMVYIIYYVRVRDRARLL